MKKKLKASTLIEVLVAMTIIITCASIGMLAVSNASRDINSNIKIEADILVDKLMNDSKIEKDFTNKIFEFSVIRVERTLLPYYKYKRLWILQFEAFNSLDQKIGEKKEIILFAP